VPLRPLSTPVVFLLSVPLFVLAPRPTAAQSASSIAEQMKARYQEQLTDVDNYVVETTMYTSYHRTVMKEGELALQTEVKMNDESSLFSAMGNAPMTTSSEPAHYEDLAENATYAGSETVNGVECHVLRVQDASEMKSDAQEMTYYVDVDRYVPVRLQTIQPPQQGEGKPTEVVVDFEDYRTTKGITLAWRTTMQMNMDMSEEQRQKMEKMVTQIENLPEGQREMMKKQMPVSFERIRQIMSGDPITIAVKDVHVNTDIPEGTFDSAGSGQ